MSEGSGNWVGKKVKTGWALKMRDVCVSYMCRVCIMCMSKGNHTGVKRLGQFHWPPPTLWRCRTQWEQRYEGGMVGSWKAWVKHGYK